MDDTLIRIVKDRITILLRERALDLQKEMVRMVEDHAARGMFGGIMVKRIADALAADHERLADELWDVTKALLLEASITHSDELESTLKTVLGGFYANHLKSVERLALERAVETRSSVPAGAPMCGIIRADDLGRGKLKNNIELFCHALRQKVSRGSVSVAPSGSGAHKWDVFICHATEDSEEVATPLASELQRLGRKVWLDKRVLKIGDSLLQKIDEGLAESRYGIVILSPSFFGKAWAVKELDGLVQKEMGGRKVILPVWHKMTREDVARHSPTLAGRMAGNTGKGIGELAKELVLALSEDEEVDPIPSSDLAKEEPVVVSIRYEKLQITGELHRYSLVFTIKLGKPPAENSFRVRLLWPKLVRISKLVGFTEGSVLKKNRMPYSEYYLNHTGKLYPGLELTVVSPNGPAIVEYEFDGGIWDAVDEGEVLLFWEIYFEDQMPSTGHKDFKELNWF